MEHINGFKAAVAAVVGCLTALWGWFGWLVVAWVVCMLLDYGTGTAAALRAGETTAIVNAARLRIKESDRIAAMQEELAKFGGQVLAKGETVTVKGLGGALRAPTQPLNSHNDHRVAMALSVAAWAAGLPALLEDAGAVAKSWPTFFEDMARGLGTRRQVREE